MKPIDPSELAARRAVFRKGVEQGLEDVDAGRVVPLEGLQRKLGDVPPEREFDANKGCFNCFHSERVERPMPASEWNPVCRRLNVPLPMDGGYRCTSWEPIWKRPT